MSPQNLRRAKLAALVAVLWLGYRALDFTGGSPELWSPTVATVVFAVLGELLGVVTMPLVVVFGVAFYIHDLAVVHWGAPTGVSQAERLFRLMAAALGLSLSSLLGPVVCGMVAFALTRTIRRGKPPAQPGWGRRWGQ